MKKSAFHALVAFVIAGMANGNAHAAMITISGTGQFDSSLGTLNSVVVRFGPGSAPTTSASATHTLNPDSAAIVGSILGGPFLPLAHGARVNLHPIVLDVDGVHSHSVNFPSFTWNGVARDYLPNSDTLPSGAHPHLVDFGEVTVSVVSSLSTINLLSTSTSSEPHNHGVLIPSLSHEFTGAEMTAWLIGNPTPVMSLPSFTTTSDPGHSHRWDVFDKEFSALINGVSGRIRFQGNPLFLTSINGGHWHSVSSTTLVSLDTTFDYTPFPVVVSATPEPASMALLGLTVIGGIGLRWRQRNTQLSA